MAKLKDNNKANITRSLLDSVAENVTNMLSPFIRENRHSEAVLMWRN